MPVGGGLFSGAEYLERGPQGGGGVRGARKPGVDQGDGTALASAADGHESDAALGKRVEHRPAPQGGDGVRLGSRGHQSLAPAPQRGQVCGVEVGVEPLQRGGLVGDRHVGLASSA